ncbi:LGFP repeat-containing protein [Microbacterium oxydans]|uniref:LGFP repeat-containing protein n=1 Tax=Microbacterium oxydans TaxID=82380 RepID=UPI00226B7291|nr:hypothetical protein [Microbacterium oxydans]WAA67378.1 hypothetical protein MME74_06405 [Microbacterium oxydans]
MIGTAAPAAVAQASVSSAPAIASGAVSGPAATGIAKSTLVGFNAGNIISDAVFTDKRTMTEPQIQAFFNSKVSRCLGGRDENNEAIVCLKDFKMNTVTRPADAYCSGYNGAANESAARIIYRVAQACDINPQVLIVMLQKEQGLITHTWPSAWRYRIALGQGCPDTAPCDPNYIGFFHQIYGAARQMQIYMEGKWFQWYAPGKTWNILYNPKASCGTSPVYVANKATSALYYYTPYQPNAAALRAGYGEGDGCSAYGNRNFYNYFTDWFGSTQKPPASDPLGDIRRAHTGLGGATGVLGAAKTNPTCGATIARCTVSYANGIITWTKALGALPVYGPVYKEYVAQGALGGKLGYPKDSPTTVTDPNGNGIAQQFDTGWIHQSAAGAFTSSNRTMTAYSAAGWIRGKLSWPVGPEVCTSKSCIQDFGDGVIGSLTGKPAVAVVGTNTKAIDAAYTASGGSTGPLGAVKDTFTFVQDPNGNGLVRQFANGWIHASAAGAFTTSNALMTAYSGAGWLRGKLGWPTSDESKVTDPNGNGAAQSFQGGWIHSSAKGSFTSSARVMSAYSKAGWVRGSLGWPVGAEVCTGVSCAQAFAGGIISFSGTAEATSTVGISSAAIAKVHADPASSPVALGSAVDASASIVADPRGSGLAQKFSGGWIHSSAAGTFASSNTIMTAYSAAGWVRGKLGWPTGAETCTATSCSQVFQGGTIAYQKGKAAVLLLGVEGDAIDVAYAAQGGAAGALGAAAAQLTFVQDPNGNGLVRQFANGWIHASAAGAFTTSNALMTAYSGAGWLRGKLGWPTSDESKVTDPNGNGAAQSFQGGWIHSSAKGSFTSSARVMSAYSKAGWVRGSLGWPVGAEVCTGVSCAQAFAGGIISFSGTAEATSTVGISSAAIAKVHADPASSPVALGSAVDASASIVADPRGSGLAQKFSGGWIHSSAAGTFASSNTIMTAYSAAGWVRGKLGWPTGAETCTATSCSQVFQGGTINYVKGKAATVVYR